MIIYLLALFVALTVLWLSYWTIVRTVILDSAVDELHMLKSRVDDAIIEGVSGSQSEPAQALSKNLEFPESIRWASFSSAIYARIFNHAEIKTNAVKEQQMFESSPLWIREIWEREVRVSVKAALANAPAWWIPLTVVLFVSVFSRKVENWWKETEMATSKLKVEMSPAMA
jgi:hypothetical protein